MKKLLTILGAFALAVVTGCSSTDNVTNVTSCQPSPFKPGTVAAPLSATKWPACTVPVNFSMDDTANKVFQNGEAMWKGSFQYDSVTRVAYFDATWNGGNGPHVPLYDDGPWTTGGHEPIGEVAGDHIFGATVFVFLPTAEQTWEYGLVDHAFGDGWIWRGSNGSFKVQPTSAAPIDAAGIAMLPFGTTDMKLELNTAQLTPPAGGGAWDTTEVRVKGSPWSWQEVTMYDDGTHGDTTAADGIWTFRLSDWVGAGHQFYHSGLLGPGDHQFVFVFGPSATSKEYKVPTPPTAGVSAFTMAEGAVDWTSTTVLTQAAGDKNTYITVP